MTASKPPFKTSDDAEAAFYNAFNHCDIDKMKTVWADDDIICVHPGAQALSGYEPVTRSWRHIFINAELPDIRINVLRQTVNGTLAIHVVEEHISAGMNNPSAVVLATNVYKQYDAGWLMIEHHASMIRGNHEGRTIQ